MKVAVVGGSGFIGSHVIDKLLDAGHDVTVFDMMGPHRDGVRHIFLDLLDFHRVVVALAGGYEAVYLLAAMANVDDIVKSPLESVLVNSQGVVNVLEALRRHGGRLIFSSTVWVYMLAPSSESGPERLDETTTLCVENVNHIYTASKVAAELYIRSYQRLYGVEFSILRYGIPYGPRGRQGTVITNFVERALQVLWEARLQISGRCSSWAGRRRRTSKRVSVSTSSGVGRRGRSRAMPLRIAHVVNDLAATTDAIVRVNAHDRSRFQPYLISFDDSAINRAEFDLYPDVKALCLGDSRGFGRLRRLAKYVREENVQLLHTYHGRSSFCARWVSRWLSVPNLFEDGGTHFGYGVASRMLLMSNVVLCDRILCPSQTVWNSYGAMERLLADVGRVRIIPYGISTEEMASLRVDRVTELARYEVDPSCVVFVHTGQIGRAHV